MQQRPQASESEATHPPAIEVSVLPRRSLMAVVGLLVLTVGSLAVAWLFPDITLLHFLWVAQAVPVFYLLLAWWGIPSLHLDDDAA